METRYTSKVSTTKKPNPTLANQQIVNSFANFFYNKNFSGEILSLAPTYSIVKMVNAIINKNIVKCGKSQEQIGLTGLR